MTTPPVAQVDVARGLAIDLKRQWRKGGEADAAAALAAHPELARHKSVVLDLAYEEYLLREKAGGAPDPGAFAGRFPAFRASIRAMLDEHQLLTERPELLDPKAAEWPAVESQFEGLDLLAELGKGAFGRAYLAFDPDTSRLCVLKLATGRSIEAKVIGRLAHPHVTDVYWARAVGPRTAVCMPFVGVSTLADVVSTAFPHPGDAPPAAADVILHAAAADQLAGEIERRSAAVVRPGEGYLVGAAAVAARIADAVGYLHGKGVAHGDLKPSNVVVGPGGVPHLIDFNLSTEAGAPAAVRGTPAYMAPELLDAAAAGVPPAGIDLARADLFSLGAVVFELLTGRLPVPPPASGPWTASVVAAADAGAFAALAAAARRPLPALPAALPPAAAAALAACLAADPAARPASAGELAAALDQFVQDRRPAPG
ncbi:MAG TPA: protein kinase, partial [Urbifossiella sp.]|nr:protein kinase [Urbifossiella sp.]